LPRGGPRKGAGRPTKEKIEVKPLTKDLAQKLYLDPSTEKRWAKLRDSKDARLRFDVEKEIQNQAIGKAVQPVAHGDAKGGPVKVNVTIRRVGA
jgi:hypothetical protein